MENYSEENMLIVKGRFKSNSMNLFGQFIIAFNSKHHLETYNIIVSTYSDLYNTEPHSNWDNYDEMITDIKWKGNFNTSMTSALMDQINKLNDEQQLIDRVYDNAHNYDYDNLDLTLFDIINRIIHDKNLLLETGIQEITLQEYQDTKTAREKPSEQPEQADGSDQIDSTVGLEEGSVILPIKAIVAPVKGKPIYDLKIGDKIMVNIQPLSDRANYFIDLLDLREKDHIKPTPASVIDIKMGSGKKDPIEILTELGPGIYGKLSENEKQVKLRIFNPKLDTDITSYKADGTPTIAGRDQEKRLFSAGSFIMLALFVIILALFIILILFSW